MLRFWRNSNNANECFSGQYREIANQMNMKPHRNMGFKKVYRKKMAQFFCRKMEISKLSKKCEKCRFFGKKFPA